MIPTQLTPPGYHTLRQKERLEDLAKAYGTPSADLIWADPRNADLRILRASSRSLQIGDIIYIPGPGPGPTIGPARAERQRETDQTHVFDYAVVPTTLALCRLALPDLTIEGAEPADATELERLQQRTRIEPFSDAVGILIQVVMKGQKVSPAPDKLIFFRTDHAGTIRSIDESRIEDYTGIRAKPPACRFPARDEFLMYVSASVDQLKRAISALRTDFASALSSLGFTRFRVAPAPAPGSSEPDPLGVRNEYLASILKSEVFAPVAKITTPWYEGGHITRALPGSKVHPYGRYIFARSDPINALLTAQFVAASAVSYIQQSAPAFGLFEFARTLHDTAREQERSNALEQNWRSDHIDRWVRYAYDCGADQRISPELFRNAVRITVSHWGWIDDANEIADYQGMRPCVPGKEPPRHPLADPATGRVRGPECFKYYQYYGGRAGEEGTYAYFALSRFPSRVADKIGADWYAQTEKAQEQLGHATDQMTDLLHRLFENRAQLASVSRALLSWHGDLDSVVAGLREYLDLATALKWPWWEFAEAASLDPILAAWAAHDKHGELKTGVNMVATAADKIASLFKEHFGDWETVQMVREIIGKKIEPFRIKVGGITERLQEKGGVSRSIGDTKITADFPNRTLVLEVGGKAPMRAEVPFELAEEVAPTSKKVGGKLKGGRRRTKVRRIPGPPKVQTVIKAELPVLRNWPYAAILVGQAIQLEYCWEQFRDAQRSQGNRVFFGVRLVSGAGQFAGSAAGLAGLIGHHLHPRVVGGEGFLRAVDKYVGGAGALLEAGANAYEGTVLLLDDSEELRKVWAAGQVVDATLYTVKGMALASGGPALLYGAWEVTFGGAAAASRAASTFMPRALFFVSRLNVYLIIVSLIVLAVDIGLFLARDPHSIIDDVIKSLEKAVNDEFGTLRRGTDPQAIRSLTALHSAMNSALV